MRLGSWNDLLINEVAEGMDEWCLNFWDDPDTDTWGSWWYCR